MMTTHRFLVVLVTTLAGQAGCLDLTAPEPPPGPVEINQLEMQGWVSHYRDTTIFDRVSQSPYPSALVGTAFIAVYASRDISVPFEVIAPEQSGSEMRIAANGIIVREVLDASMIPQKLTVMAKGPAGYNPRLGDWYFAVTDLHGVPLLDSAGAPRAGRMVDCFGCHVPRASDDYLFGVPMTDRIAE